MPLNARPSALRDASQIICMQQGSISRAGGTYTVRFKNERVVDKSDAERKESDVAKEESDVAKEESKSTDEDLEVASVDVTSLRPATQSEVTALAFACVYLDLLWAVVFLCIARVAVCQVHVRFV